MLKPIQILKLSIVAIAFWGIATVYIRYVPESFVSPLRSGISFVITVPVGWLSILFIRRVGALAPNQLLPGVSVVGALAMMADSLVLRWAPQTYGNDGFALVNAAAWLLWGYGMSLALALFLAARSRPTTSPSP